MPTNRTPIRRSSQPAITPQMIALFDRMQRARSQEQYDEAHGQLWDCYQMALRPRTRPWEWPLCVDPRDDVNPYPPGSNAYRSWQPNLRAQEMWKALDAASREAKRAEREARKAATQQPPDQPAPG
jgi:hypothetical protein